MKIKSSHGSNLKGIGSGAPVRLNKYLADAGIASRRKADELIKQGLVSVNNHVITDLGTKIKSTDRVSVNGNPVKMNQKLVYILLNKPKDYITTTSDEKSRKTVLDIVRSSKRIYPVGRLDRNTTGVLLLTNDGELAYRLTHPKYEIERVYNATLDKNLTVQDAKKIAEGIELDNEHTSPCEIIINPKNKSNVILTLIEGKNHEVKRIFEKFGYTVKKLDRKYFAGISTQGLTRGQYRHLKLYELQMLKKFTGLY
ncbi:MAG: rRNA pseudouridine synthase [Bacteroidetes bacterium]|nr:MAG: rRNA pseudouridine synthase [Bacteroidota bacterium]